MEAPSFFDYMIENQGGKRTTKFLEEMKNIFHMMNLKNC